MNASTLAKAKLLTADNFTTEDSRPHVHNTVCAEECSPLSMVSGGTAQKSRGFDAVRAPICRRWMTFEDRSGDKPILRFEAVIDLSAGQCDRGAW